ncbi:hypothetical protein H6G72_02275 [Planktothricoides sp. FACHB-1370]|uniref:Uncharacterized protein n=1 Tax=Planktothricoides raciborskii FACHB-1370 TaxID=2949576 RepID=A0ABR8E7U7_9CYAN|nr:hypothetical protein [Planktothricoides raciborskii FACHB-1370]
MLLPPQQTWARDPIAPISTAIARINPQKSLPSKKYFADDLLMQPRQAAIRLLFIVAL